MTIVRVLVILFFVGHTQLDATKYICFPSYAQFGDRIIQYSLACWASHVSNIQMIVDPFPYSDELMLHKYELSKDSVLSAEGIKKRGFKKFSKDSFVKDNVRYSISIDHSFYNGWKKYDRVINKYILQNDSVSISPKAKKVGRVIASEIDKDQILLMDRSTFDYIFFASREDANFLQRLRKVLSPIKSIEYLPFPTAKISVAIHIRCVGQFEACPQFRQEISLRVPFIDFYISQLRRLSNYLNNQSLYVYIFTNHSNPTFLVDQFKKELHDYNNITYAYRESHAQEATVIQDFFRMSQFDCLIRSDSAFSKAAQLLGNHKIIIAPRSGVWHNKTLYIDKISMIITDDNFGKN